MKRRAHIDRVLLISPLSSQPAQRDRLNGSASSYTTHDTGQVLFDGSRAEIVEGRCHEICFKGMLSFERLDLLLCSGQTLVRSFRERYTYLGNLELSLKLNDMILGGGWPGMTISLYI